MISKVREIFQSNSSWVPKVVRFKKEKWSFLLLPITYRSYVWQLMPIATVRCNREFISRSLQTVLVLNFEGYEYCIGSLWYGNCHWERRNRELETHLVSRITKVQNDKETFKIFIWLRNLSGNESLRLLSNTRQKCSYFRILLYKSSCIRCYQRLLFSPEVVD